MNDVVAQANRFIATHAKFLNPWSPLVVEHGHSLDTLLLIYVFEKLWSIPDASRERAAVLISRFYAQTSGTVFLGDLDVLLRDAGCSDSEILHVIEVVGLGCRLRALLLREQRMQGQEGGG